MSWRFRGIQGDRSTRWSGRAQRAARQRAEQERLDLDASGGLSGEVGEVLEGEAALAQEAEARERLERSRDRETTDAGR